MLGTKWQNYKETKKKISFYPFTWVQWTHLSKLEK